MKVNIKTYVDVVQFYDLLTIYIFDLRSNDKFETYKLQAIQKCGVDYFKTRSRIKRKKFYDENLLSDTTQNKF